MRPLHHGDIACAARALLGLAPGLRRRACWRMIAEAEAAHAHMRRTGRLHPIWGNGALMASARRRPLPPEPDFDHADYRRCWRMVLEMVEAASDHANVRRAARWAMRERAL